ncbi:MAG: relaxase domain-containing protein [Saprospiraceae bacterium]|nr:relaxase domain-containing protein [Saprospiraceae bacterium]
MLRITTIKNAEGAIQYFKSALVQQDYYTENEKITGYWHGSLSNTLGIVGEIREDHYRAIANNRHSITGEKLTPRDSSKRRCGSDFTWNAPKSISLCYGITEDPEILAAHQKAVHRAMKEVEKNHRSINP